MQQRLSHKNRTNGSNALSLVFSTVAFFFLLLLSSSNSVVSATSISPTKTCYTRGERVSLTFENDNPRPRDKVAVFSANTPLSNAPNPTTHWKFACGTRQCAAPRDDGTISFTASLPNGRYRGFLLRNNNGGLARSIVFQVATTCAGSGGGGTPPLPAPTPVPVSNEVRTDKIVYESGEPIEVTFSTRTPRVTDMIAIYRANVPQNNLRTGELWLRTCNRQGANNCPSRPSTGSLTFGPGGPSESWNSAWPLPTGTYRAYLVRRNSAPWPVIARSSTFEVRAGASQRQGAALDRAESQIRGIINSRPDLGPKFLRLIFHDCIGGCDGCVDLDNRDNFGLLTPIQALRPVVADEGEFLSRADIWALASFVAIDRAQGRQQIAWNMNTVGRVDCENTGRRCVDNAGRTVACRDTKGSHHDHPAAEVTTRELFTFFRDEFGYTTRQTVAVMGAHTIGQLSTENSGIDGPNGWMINSRTLDNEYYAELVGGTSPNSPRSELVQGAPGWGRNIERNDGNSFPNKHIWTGFPGGTKIVMLNADIALVRQLDGSNVQNSGRVTCRFVGENTCPVAEQSFRFAVEYTFDNMLWLRDFRQVMIIMIENGYRRDGCNGNGPCRLIPN